MRSWLILGIVIAVIVLALGGYVFFQAVEAPKEDEAEAVASLVLAEDDVASMDDFQLFFGMETIYVATVTHDDGEQYYWLYDDDYERIGNAAFADLENEETIVDEVRSEQGDIAIRDVRVGYEEDTLVYELVYTDPEDNLYYDYYTAADGESLKQYRITAS
ncbi:hypothetical protein [Natribacillus halophilus]|uniref:Uncharacterized protein YpmB n=1 Tax=Natribacillus halophilus TaxID=549003 RepID=A0A1G8JA38_9BACI|nr:hypothetical protein [Natribacillus halophilus]SDI28129.1 Uncharacterized protein YpmB [Natribacillus halophilus]